MKPIKQTRFGPQGNCWQACIASILELELDKVPDFVNEYDDWWKETQDWFYKYGYEILFNEGDHNVIGIIGCGISPRGYYHATIIDYERNVIFDPHPDNTGIEDVTDFFALYYL